MKERTRQTVDGKVFTLEARKRPLRVRLRKAWHAAALRGFARCVWLLSRFVPYRLGVRAGGALGNLLYPFLRRERERALAHLAQAFPERDEAWHAATARACFAHIGRAIFELALARPDRLGEVTRFVGADNLRKAMDMGRGVVFVTGHVGNWELMGAAIAQAYPVSVVAAPVKPEPVNDLVVALRRRLGVRTILRDRPGAARELIRVFRQGRALGILIDQDTKVEGAYVDFFGRPAWTPTAAAAMALKFGAPVVFGWTHRDPDGRHTITIEGPLELVQTGDLETDIVANTALFTRLIEAAIRRRPEQWVWMHRRWRRRPPRTLRRFAEPAPPPGRAAAP
ncbi:lysophospholipid acyltransferase family protein [Dissulfurirhabdus thermomarina]|uniref:Lysophospholipid acyltransferase family protein n=1 Tax=Dissulfurirhabdus thermomarina TaxID=1765737 RepID=A0A6N9TMZ5_DISTH|nr:lysophospholipid acyltransferase family protein [Dissulfurirhabdus thermomarina]NDY42661.1 lysophospholipid acyltransferase family protein [Dissulfurirhabdus thermomarina]NMX23444.1 lysophospholipid acyltransferase family protein [Dissulfurirhabdus thermomarina]